MANQSAPFVLRLTEAETTRTSKAPSQGPPISSPLEYLFSFVRPVTARLHLNSVPRRFLVTPAGPLYIGGQYLPFISPYTRFLRAEAA